MFQKVTEILTLVVSTLVQRLLYREPLPKDFAPKRILVVKLDHLGDVLLATPVFSNLRRAYPEATLHALTGEWGRGVLERHPDVAQVITYNAPAFSRSGQPTSLRGAVDLYRQLRRERYDLMIELRSDSRIVAFAAARLTPKRLTRAALQVSNRFGGTRFSSMHETARNLDVLKHAGIPIPVKTAIFSVTPDDKRWAAERLAQHQLTAGDRIIAIHPGSPIPLKRWSPARYAELADWLIEQQGGRVLFVGVADERPIIADIQSRMQHGSTNIAGQTNLVQLASILHLCSVFIGNDSGPMHLAAAVGTQTLGLYGPGDPGRFAPAGERCQTLRRTADCRCTGATCRLGASGCMSAIQVTDVIELLEAAGYLNN